MLRHLLHRIDDARRARGRPEESGDKAGEGAAPKPPPVRGLAGKARAALRRLGTAARRRPRTTAVVLAAFLLVGAVVGLYACVWRQWEAARAALKEGRPKEARSDLDLCLSLWPDSVRVHLLAARAARLSGDFPAAESHLNRCLKLGDDKADVQLEFLLMRAQTGEEDVVAEDLLRYVDNKHPETSVIMETLAGAYMDKLRFAPALAALNRWLEAEPNSTRALEWRGWVMERLNQQDQAVEDYERALTLDPNLLSPHLRLADMALAKSDPTTALPHLERLDRRYRDRPDVKALLGRCRFQQGQTEEARRLMEAAVKDLPKDPQLLVALGRLDVQEGRAAEAEQYLRRALQEDPTDAEARYTLIAALRYQGREEEAASAQQQYEKDAALLRQAEKQLSDETVHPSNDPNALYDIGELFLRGGQGRVGEYWLNRALEIDPRHKPSLKALAEYYDGKGEKEQAEAYRRRLAEAGGEAASP